MRCTVHAENTPILQWRGERLMRSGRRDAAAHLEQHSDIATIEAVSRVAIFSEWTGCKIHIAHESTRFSLPHIRFAKQRGVDLTVETCPHYLFLSTEDGARLGANFLRVKPPVREPGHQNFFGRLCWMAPSTCCRPTTRRICGRKSAALQSGIARRGFRVSKPRCA